MKKALKQIGYFVLGFILLIFLIVWTQDEETIEKIFMMTDVTEKIWNYYDYEQYSEDLLPVAFFGHMKVTFEGDTSGLGINPHFYRFHMGERYDEHYRPACEYINLDNYELLEENERFRTLSENATEEQVGTLEFIIDITKLGPGNMPIWYEVTLLAGTELDPLVYHSKYMNMGNRRKLKLSLEHGIDRELKIFAKKFFKVHQNREQLRELYKSVYMK
ncbi:hypothetical protein KQI63_00840 [bacterium]|nr:hypothetical protein [bacterium]